MHCQFGDYCLNQLADIYSSEKSQFTTSFSRNTSNAKEFIHLLFSLFTLQTYLEAFANGNTVYTDLWDHLQMACSFLLTLKI